MSIFSKFKNQKRSGDWWENLIGRNAYGTSAGVLVNEKTSLHYSPVFACVSLAAETISTLPLSVYEKTKDGRRERTDKPIYKILHEKANRHMSAQVFREVMQWNCELRGVALAEKRRNGYGDIAELIPMSPDVVTEYYTDTKTGELFFKTNQGILSQNDVFYFFGPGSDGVTPKSRVSLAAESMGIGVAAEEYGRRYFGHGTNIGGFIRRPDGKSLTSVAFDRLKAQMNEKYKGLQNSHGLIILEEGAEFQKVGLSNNDSQFLETRRFQVEEVCRWFGMKPHMIGDLSHATYSNIEQQGIEAVTYSWRPRCVRWEQAIKTQLITDPKLYAEHNLDGLMRGDLKSQVEAWHLLVQDGILNADEVRKMMNLNPQEDDQGKIYFMPLNMIDKSAPAPEPVVDNTPEPDKLPEQKSIKPGELRAEQRRAIDHRRKISARFSPKLLTMAKNIVNKDAGLIRNKMAKLSQEEFTGWIAAEYLPEMSKTTRAEAAPVITAYAMALVPAIADEVGDVDGERYDAFTEGYLDSFATRYEGRQKKTLIDLSKQDEYRDLVEAQLVDWESTRPQRIQKEEVTRIRSAFVKAAYTYAGVTKLRWVAFGKSCPFCTMLDGKIVGITEAFADKGSSLAPEGKAPLTFSSSVGHAPAHEGCDCDIAAE